MVKLVRMPKFTDNGNDYIVVSWFKEQWDFVNKNELIAKIQTDEGISEFHSPKSGYLWKAINEGEPAKAGLIIAYVSDKVDEKLSWLQHIPVVVDAFKKPLKKDENDDEYPNEKKQEVSVEEANEIRTERLEDEVDELLSETSQKSFEHEINQNTGNYTDQYPTEPNESDFEGVSPQKDKKRKEILMPRLTETETHHILYKWHKKIGEAVKEGEVIAEIETDKAYMEFESPYSGFVLNLLVSEGDQVAHGSVIALVGDEAQKGRRITVKISNSYVQNGINTVDEIIVKRNSFLNKGDVVILISSKDNGHLEKIVSPANGYINEIHVTKGSVLNAGDPLFSLSFKSEQEANPDSKGISNDDTTPDNQSSEFGDSALKILGGIGKVAALGAGLYFGGKVISGANKRHKERKQKKADVKREKENHKRREKERKEDFERNKEIAKSIEKASKENAKAEQYAMQERYKQNNKCPRCGGRKYIEYQGSGAVETCRQCNGKGYIR